MLPSNESPKQTVRRCFREIRESLRRANRWSLRDRIDLDGLHISCTASRQKPARASVADLPPELWSAHRRIQQTYRALAALRKTLGPEVYIGPARIAGWLDEEHRDNRPHSTDTISHHLADLRVLRLAWSPERKDADKRGWRLGTPPGLPTENRQTLSFEPGGYASRVADEGVRRFTRGDAMSKPKIWVPGERDEYSGAVVVTDARTERAIGVTERTGEMKVPTRSGKLATVAAARGELVRVEGKYAIVRFPGNQQVSVRVLGDWQLKGLTEPGAEDAEVATTGAA